MKILHTSDWHLGKRLAPFDRTDEQKEVLKEIEKIVEDNAVDVLLIAGDVFDVSVPPAKAEEIFYRAALDLSRHCLVVAIAGNHDDGERLKAPDTLAKASGILLCGGFDCSDLSCESVEAKEGGIIYRKGGERLNLALCPYLTESRKGDPPAQDFAAYCAKVLSERTFDVFSPDGCNILVAHLFMTGSLTGEERELGSAKMLPLSVLPKCDYAALGHIHRPMKLTHNVFYSGSILNYAFDGHEKKEVILFDTVTKETKHIPLVSGKKLVTVEANGFDAALAAIEEAGDNFVKLVYDCAVPLSASQTVRLEKAGKLVQLEIVPQGVKREAARRAHKSARELFEEYYRNLNGGESAPEELTAEFMALFDTEEL